MYNSEGLFQPLYDNETVEAFNNASDCIRQQYLTFSAAGMYYMTFKIRISGSISNP